MLRARHRYDLRLDTPPPLIARRGDVSQGQSTAFGDIAFIFHAYRFTRVRHACHSFQIHIDTDALKMAGKASPVDSVAQTPGCHRPSAFPRRVRPYRRQRLYRLYDEDAEFLPRPKVSRADFDWPIISPRHTRRRHSSAAAIARRAIIDQYGFGRASCFSASFLATTRLR